MPSQLWKFVRRVIFRAAFYTNLIASYRFLGEGVVSVYAGVVCGNDF